jgi:hypothetical protein
MVEYMARKIRDATKIDVPVLFVSIKSPPLHYKEASHFCPHSSRGSHRAYLRVNVGVFPKTSPGAVSSRGPERVPITET